MLVEIGRVFMPKTKRKTTTKRATVRLETNPRLFSFNSFSMVKVCADIGMRNSLVSEHAWTGSYSRGENQIQQTSYWVHKHFKHHLDGSNEGSKKTARTCNENVLTKVCQKHITEERRTSKQETSKMHPSLYEFLLAGCHFFSFSLCTPYITPHSIW